jgi:N,N'-diacetyllegionaminate synthase
MMIPTKEPYIIAETAFHHQGDLTFLKELAHEAIKLQVNAIKVHLLLDLDDYMISNHEAINILRDWCLSENDWDAFFSEVDNIDIVALCNDAKSIDYILNSSFEFVAIEIHATGLNDVFLLEKAAKFKNTVILGTGGSTLDEIDYAINYLRSCGKDDIFLMHGFQNYPTDYKDIKMDRMEKLNKLFDLPVGYADHTDPENPFNEFISCLGIAKGFNVIEKHFTHKYGEKRIDAQSAVTLNQMKTIKEMAQAAYLSLGSANSLKLTSAELNYGNTGPMKKAIVARNSIKKGELITLDNIAFKRTNESSSIKQLEISKIINNRASKDIDRDEIVDLSNVSFEFSLDGISQFKNTN